MLGRAFRELVATFRLFLGQNPPDVARRILERAHPDLPIAFVHEVGDLKAGARQLLHVVGERSHAGENRFAVAPLGQAGRNSLALVAVRHVPLGFEHHGGGWRKRRLTDHDEDQHHQRHQTTCGRTHRADEQPGPDRGSGNQRHHVANPEGMSLEERIPRQRGDGGQARV